MLTYDTEYRNDPLTTQAVPVSAVGRRITMLIAHIRFACQHLQPMSVRHLIYDASPAHWPAGDRTAALSQHDDDLPVDDRPSASPHRDIDRRQVLPTSR